MATRAVKMNEEAQSGSKLPLNKVTGTIQDTREFLHDVRVEMIATVAFFGVFLALIEWLAQHGMEKLFNYFHV